MVTDMYSLVESVIGVSLVIWGAAIVINKRIFQSFFDTFTDIERNETLGYLTASMFLILGLIIVSVHNDWYWGSSLIVTLLGWILVLKATAWLFFPLFLSNFSKQFSSLVSNSWFRIVYGLIIALLGLFIFSKYYVENIMA